METITDTKKLGSSVALVGNKSDLSHLRQVTCSKGFNELMWPDVAAPNC